jgi:hypothetical protein
MLPRLDSATVAPPSAADAAGAAPAFGDGRQAAFQRALQTLVGQQVQAEVLSKYSDGSFLVKVAENSVRMALPDSVQVGAELPLTVIAAQPRPTFQLGTGPLPGNPAALVYTETPAAGAAAEGLYGPPLPGQETQAAAGRPQAGAAGPSGQAAGDGAAAEGAAGAGQASEAEAAGSAAAAAGKAGASATGGNAGLPGGAAAGAAADLPAELAADPRAAAAGRAAAAPGTNLPAGANPGATAANAAGAGLAAGLAASATNGAATAGAAAANAAAGAAAGAPGGAALAAGLQASGVDLTRPQRLAATLLGKAPLTAAADLPKLDPSTPAPTLSSTARVLTSVLSAAQGSAATLIGKVPLFGGDGPPNTAQLAQRLGDTIGQSGLFYESHVAEWARGERGLPELMREPQMQRLAQGAESAARAAAGPDLSAAQMINQQLHAQEQSRVQWNGQAWPGQNMQWEIRREQRDAEQQGQGGGDGKPEAVWRSGVKFRFAMLGEVSATVTLVGDQVHIQMQTDSGGAATTLRAYAGQLEQAMEAAGAPLSSLTIRQDSEAGDE